MAKDNEASRRSILHAGLGVLVAGAAQSASAQQPVKLAQKDVAYQEQPKGDQRCSKCLHFLPPSSCQLVAGTINPNGWCALYAAKPA